MKYRSSNLIEMPFRSITDLIPAKHTSLYYNGGWIDGSVLCPAFPIMHLVGACNKSIRLNLISEKSIFPIVHFIK